MSRAAPQRPPRANPPRGSDLPKPGRPRSEKAREAILHAAVELLLTQEMGGVSMDAVAERAGVSKATIYRWWPTKETLALEALYREWAPAGQASPDTGSLRRDLQALLAPWVAEISSRPYGALVANLMAKARGDRAFADEWMDRLVEPRRERARRLFGRAAERGEIVDGVDIELMVDLIYGPVYLRLLQAHAPLTDAYVRQVIDVVLDGLLAVPDKETNHG